MRSGTANLRVSYLGGGYDFPKFFKYQQVTILSEGCPSRWNVPSQKLEIDLYGKFPTYQRISNQIDADQLAIFNPSRYIRSNCHFTVLVSTS